MRMRWWQSIRWRLAIGSLLVALLATTSLAAVTIFAVAHYYSEDQTARLNNLAEDSAQRLGEGYAATAPFDTKGKRVNRLVVASQTVFLKRIIPKSLTVRTTQGEEYLFMVINVKGREASVYPAYYAPSSTRETQLNSFLKQVLYIDEVEKCVSDSKDLSTMCHALQQAQQGTVTTGQISQNLPIPRPFAVEPITEDGQYGSPVVGVLLMLPPQNTLPSFLSSVIQTVIIAAILVAFIFALLAILFASTITRPLSKLTDAARVMASGDYSIQVHTKAQGEIDELAHSFNEMVAQLNRDVEQLRQQELWRRELIMSITHDLATPLTAIAGLGESLVDGITQSREEYEATGRIIVHETLRLRRLVRDLHVMAKMEAGALEPQYKDIRLAPLVDNVIAVLASEFEKANVEPRNLIPYTFPSVPADPDMLSRVFSNLCDNAMRHTPAGGIVTIEAILQKNSVTVSVTDSGEGIPSEALRRVFERFFRGDSARRSTTGGSGLGLAIVRAIIEAHKGCVWAENVPTGGARIAFTLPCTISSNKAIEETITLPMQVLR